MNVGDIMTEVNKVKGVGPKSVQLLNKIGINTVDDLVTHYPYRYDLLERTNLKEVGPDDKVIIDGKVDSLPLILRFNKGLNKMNFRLAIPNGVVGVSIFNRAFMKSHLTIGASVIVIGKYDKIKNIVTASDIRFGTLGKEEKIEPVYHLTSGLTNKNISTYIFKETGVIVVPCANSTIAICKYSLLYFSVPLTIQELFF